MNTTWIASWEWWVWHCHQSRARTFVSSLRVSESSAALLVGTLGTTSQLEGQTWKEQSRLSSTLIMAPALSNSPQ